MSATRSTTKGQLPIRAQDVISGVFNTARLGSGTATGSKVLCGDGVWRTFSAGDALVANPLSQFAATTSAQLAGVISDETGSGALVFGTSPTLTTPVLGVATATSINKVIVTAPATTATLTLANNSTFRTIGNDVVTLTSTADSNLTLPTSGTLMTGDNNLTELSNTATARTNLGLDNTSMTGTRYFGSATAGTNTATINVGTSTGNNSGTINIGTASAGNNSRVINIGTASGTNTSSVNIGGTLNKYTLTAPATAATITLADNSTFTTAGNFTTAGANNLTLTTTGSTNVTFPTAGLLLSASNNLSDVLSAGTSRENLGFEAAAFTGTLNVGTANSGANSATLNFGAATGNNSATLNIGTSSTGANTNSATINIGTGNSTVSSTINIGATDANVQSSNTFMGFTTFRGDGIRLLRGASGSPYVELQAPTTGFTTSYTLKFPISQGVTGYALTNADGAGQLQWTQVGVTSGTLSQFAATTSAQLAGVISDETGSGALVFATSPTLVTPALGTPTSGVMTNVTGTATGLTAGKATNIAGGLGGQILYQSAADTTALLANGTAGQYLQSNGTTAAPSWVTLAGLTGFTASLNTSSPNNTVNASMILASGGSTNQDAVISPKGTGAFMLNLPDGVSTGGDKRGEYAVDLQLYRAYDNKIASGNYSFVAGRSNEASGGDSVSIGHGNLSSATDSYTFGTYCSATGADSVSIGSNSNSLGAKTASFGYNAYASTNSSTALGAYTSAGKFDLSTVISTLHHIPIGSYTTNATPTLAVDTASINASVTVPLPEGQWGFEVYMVGRRDNQTETAVFKLAGAITNYYGAVSLIGSISTIFTKADAGAAGWAVTVTADDTNNGLKIEVTGEAAKTVLWSGTVILF